MADLREEKRRTARPVKRHFKWRRAGARYRRPPLNCIEATEDPVYGHGFELLPEPDDGDVFFDFEGDPFWTPQHDLMFLAGLLYRDEAGEWTYDERWAHTLAEQQAMIKGLVDFFAERRERYPRMHVYHYNHTEKSTIERLTAGRRGREPLREPRRVGTLRRPLHHGEERGAGGHRVLRAEAPRTPRRLSTRTAGIDQGAGAVVEYEEWMRSATTTLLRDIARYNRDDVAATRAVRDWLVEQRPRDLAWREAFSSTTSLRARHRRARRGAAPLSSKSVPEYLLGRPAQLLAPRALSRRDPEVRGAERRLLCALRQPRLPRQSRVRALRRADGARANSTDGARAGPSRSWTARSARKRRLFAGAGVPYGRASSRRSTSSAGK